jgi:hypothetical protein
LGEQRAVFDFHALLRKFGDVLREADHVLRG